MSNCQLLKNAHDEVRVCPSCLLSIDSPFVRHCPRCSLALDMKNACRGCMKTAVCNSPVPDLKKKFSVSKFFQKKSSQIQSISK